jgi:dihydropteroate synthase
VGTSRKGFLGTLTGQDVTGRTVASVVSGLAACAAGARIVRVHDVRAMADALAVWEAQKGWEAGS